MVRQRRQAPYSTQLNQHTYVRQAAQRAAEQLASIDASEALGSGYLPMETWRSLGMIMGVRR